MTAKQARPVDDPKALVPFGWAPGDYYCAKCSDCGEPHHGSDKRSARCQDCAEALRDATAPMTHPLTPREKVAALKTNDPTNPAHRLASDLQAGHFAAGESRDDLIEVLSNLPRYAALASGSGDHAELARLAEVATLGKWQNGIDDCEGVVALAEHAGNVICLPPTDDMQASLEFWPRNAAFIAAANPATVLALIAEVAALREDGEVYQNQADHEFRLRKEAERKLAEAREMLIQSDMTIRSFPGADQSHVEFIRTFLSKEAERG